MPCFDVFLFPIMSLRLVDIEADDAAQAITRAISQAEEDVLDSTADCRTAPSYTEEVARYMVLPVVQGKPDYDRSAIYLDAAHLAADQKDRADGFPVYERPGESASVLHTH